MGNRADWLEIGDRIFTMRYDAFDQQIGLVLGSGEAAVIDTRTTPSHAQELRADIGRITDLAVRVVVDTHWHSDHLFGNHEFRPAAIWGHTRCRSRLRENGEAQRAALIEAMPDHADEFRAVVIDPPDHLFDDAVTIDVGGRAMDLRYLGRGHTDADIVVTIPDAGVLFAGDLLENDAVPWFGDGYPMEWPETVERVLALVDGPVVPGHGSISDRAFVERQLAEFRAVADIARRVHTGEFGHDEGLRNMPYGDKAGVAPLDRALAQLRGELD